MVKESPGTVWHVGLVNAKQGKLAVVQMRLGVDDLSPETWRYMGRRVNTKANVYRQRKALLAAINREYGTRFERIIID